jgi:hypothetical protein
MFCIFIASMTQTTSPALDGPGRRSTAMRDHQPGHGRDWISLEVSAAASSRAGLAKQLGLTRGEGRSTFEPWPRQSARITKPSAVGGDVGREGPGRPARPRNWAMARPPDDVGQAQRAVRPPARVQRQDLVLVVAQRDGAASRPTKHDPVGAGGRIAGLFGGRSRCMAHAGGGS